MFLSSTDHTGDLSGLSGADDDICTNLAHQAGFPGTYMAWLSDRTGSPSSRFVKNPGPYVRVDGVVIATSWADLTDGNLAAAIVVTEKGNEVGTGVWRHTTTSGTRRNDNVACEYWTSRSETDTAHRGVADANTGSTWTEHGQNETFCDTPSRISCFQQS